MILVTPLGLAGAEAAPPRTAAPAGAAVYFQSPQEGQVSNPVVVRAGLTGMGVAPAGEAAPNVGHHNVLVDSKPGNPGQPIAAGDHVIVLKDGETEVALKLPHGWHQLQLVLTDANGLNFNPPVASAPISVYVKRR